MPVRPDGLAMPPPVGVTPRPAASRPADVAGARSDVDERRLGQIYAEHHPFVWRSLARLGVHDARLPDAVHDVFMVVARRLAEYEGRASMRTWLFAIAMRVAQGVRRDFAREQRERLRDVSHGSHAPHDGADAARILHDLLEHLDDDRRAVFIMAELEGMTAPEIAMATGTKLPTVYSRLRLAREELARHVARLGEGRAKGAGR